MNKFRKKPVVIEAVQLKETKSSLKEVLEFTGQRVDTHIKITSDKFDDFFDICLGYGGLRINTLEGTMLANWCDWIIKGINGEFYPCKPDIFENTYERVVE